MSCEINDWHFEDGDKVWCCLKHLRDYCEWRTNDECESMTVICDDKYLERLNAMKEE